MTTTFNPEQFLSASKASMDACMALSAKAFEGVQKLAELNMSVVKALASESAETMQTLTAIKDPQAFIAFAQAQAKPNTEKFTAYGRAVYDIVSASSEEFNKAAEAQFAQANQEAAKFIDTVAKNAPAGSESAVAALKSAVAASSAAIDNFNRVAKSTMATVKTQAERATKSKAA